MILQIVKDGPNRFGLVPRDRDALAILDSSSRLGTHQGGYSKLCLGMNLGLPGTISLPKTPLLLLFLDTFDQLPIGISKRQAGLDCPVDSCDPSCHFGRERSKPRKRCALWGKQTDFRFRVLLVSHQLIAALYELIQVGFNRLVLAGCSCQLFGYKTQLRVKITRQSQLWLGSFER